LDIPVVAFSPLGRGFLTGTVDETTLEKEEHKSDLRTRLPRFSKEHIGSNLELVKRLSSISERLGISNPQLALVWLLSRYENIHVIPGTKRIKYLRENFAAMDYELSAEDLDAVTAIFSLGSVQGERYPKAILSKSDK
jgi:aryl-alcohol dehydrogenase-like predicted oxidoreductase